VRKLASLAGQTFGRLTVLREAEQRGQYRYWLCRCDCGNEKEIKQSSLRGGLTQSCGCLAVEGAKERGLRRAMRAGERVGRLTLLESFTENRKRRWLCRCDCGRQTTVHQDSLRSGNTQSCGCIRQEVSATRMTRHGMRDSVEYNTWRSMRRRCNNPNDSAYANYGGRGIAVHPTWNDSFEAFYSDVGPRPNPKMTLDRIDNNGNYEPGNVRWATSATQNNNRRDNILVLVDSKALKVEEAMRLLGISRAAVHLRVRRGTLLRANPPSDTIKAS